MADRYLIYEQLGAGGVGTVFRAYDNQLHRWVAIKRLTASGANGNGVNEQLRQEADTLASLRHPNIVSIYDVASDEHGLFMVMELLEGEDLATVVARGPLPYDDFKELARQTLEALIAAHDRQLLHRDIKPENIKVERLPGGRLQSKIIDFGLARAGLSARKQTEDVTGSVMGSIHYMAPEQLTREPVDERTDLYSLGCVFYEALSGAKAFDGASVSEVIDKHVQHDMTPLHVIAPHVPPWLGAWVERLMAPHPNDRPANAQQAIDEFRAWERMPAMVPYMPWMAMPDPAAPPQHAAPAAREEAAIPVALVDEPDQMEAAAPRRSPLPPPRATPAHKDASSSRKNALLLAGAALAVLALGGFLLLKGGSPAQSPRDTASAGGGDAPPGTLSMPDLPAGRMMPPLDEDRVIHLIAEVGTFQGAKSSDGKPFPAYANDSVAQWLEVAPRGGNNFLLFPEDAGALPAKRIIWPVNANGPSVKGNRAALQMRASSSQSPVLEGRFSRSAAAFPFGGDPIKAPQGATLAVVFRSETSKTGVVASVRGSGGEFMSLEVTSGGGVLAMVKGISSVARLESSSIDPAQPTIAVATWNPGERQLHLLAFNPAPAPKTPAPTFQQSIAAPVPPAASALDQIVIGPFTGLLAELILYASALDESQRRLLGNVTLKNHYFR